MPCDSIQLNSLEISKMDPKLLARALTALGAQSVRVTAGGAATFTLDGVACRLGGGRFIVEAGAEHLADKVKQAYGRQSVIYAAKKNGWQIKETKPNVFAVIK